MDPCKFEYIIEEKYARQRIDKVLRELTQFSRVKVQRLIKQGHLRIRDSSCCDISYITRLGDTIILLPPPLKAIALEADEGVEFQVIYEDEDIIVIDKPAGLVVHPGTGNTVSTLVHGLLSRFRLPTGGESTRPGIVHRLDKDTSGLMVVAKTEKAHNSLSVQIAARKVSRIYRTIVWRVPHKLEGTINANIGRSQHNRQHMAVVHNGGKSAITHYRVLQVYGRQASLLECRLGTGRTHQIRVHLSHVGHSIIGDQTYGNNRRNLINSGFAMDAVICNFNRQALHAHELAFTHPSRFDENLHFISKMPQEMQHLIEALEASSLCQSTNRKPQNLFKNHDTKH